LFLRYLEYVSCDSYAFTGEEKIKHNLVLNEGKAKEKVRQFVQDMCLTGGLLHLSADLWQHNRYQLLAILVSGVQSFFSKKTNFFLGRLFGWQKTGIHP
jgi:hypothetical protein